MSAVLEIHNFSTLGLEKTGLEKHTQKTLPKFDFWRPLREKTPKWVPNKNTKMKPESKPGPPWETLGLPLEAKAAPGTSKTSKSEAQDLKMTSWKV